MKSLIKESIKDKLLHERSETFDVQKCTLEIWPIIENKTVSIQRET